VCTFCNLRRYVLTLPLCDSTPSSVLVMASNYGSSSCGTSFHRFVICMFDQAWGPLPTHVDEIMMANIFRAPGPVMKLPIVNSSTIAPSTIVPSSNRASNRRSIAS
jgi:hypothetical protein